MADGVSSNLITTNGRGTSEFGQSLMPRMPETTMPSGGGSCSNKGAGHHGTCWSGESLEGPGAIEPGDHAPGFEILHRKAKRIKFDRTVIVSSELTNRDEVLNNVGCNKNVIKIKGTRYDRMARSCDR
jgi:hypothetical protein